MGSCLSCGASLSPDATNCPACGSPAPAIATAAAPTSRRATDRRAGAAVTAAETPAAASRRTMWTIAIAVPIVMLVLIVIGFALLTGMPFSLPGGMSSAKVATAKPAPVESVVEGAVPAATTDLGVAQPELNASPNGAIVPAVIEPAARVVPTRRSAAAVYVDPSLAVDAPLSRSTSRSRDSSPQSARLLPESEALDILLPVARPFYRETETRCVGFRSLGYFNDGYTIEVRDTCSNAPLGRWRVDGATRDVLRLNADGAYRKP